MEYFFLLSMAFLCAGVYGVPYPFSHGDHGNKYLGCFHSNVARDYSITRDDFTSPNMTIDVCLASCAQYGDNTLAALSHGNRCTCFDPHAPDEFARYSSTYCYYSFSDKCAGNPLQICGRSSYMSVYCVFDSGCQTFLAEFGDAKCAGCAECEPRYGECTGPCSSGTWFGPFCTTSCPPYNHGDECQFWCGGCNKESCNITTGDCLQGCKENFINTQCRDCAPGLRGMLCDKKCPANCATCHKTNGACISCTEGYYGDQCDPCLVYCHTCHKTTGACTSCPEGYFGEYCENRKHVNIGCMLSNSLTGECEKCYPGYYKYYADCVQCSEFCTDRICNETTGACDSCIAGYHGSTCQLACTNCAACQQEDGSCVVDCQPGWHGATCGQLCPPHCLQGLCHKANASCLACPNDRADDNCDKQCPPNCEHGMCHRINASCLSCPNDREGDMCQDIVIASTDNTGRNIGLYAAIGVIGGLVVILAVGFVGFVILFKKKAAEGQALETTTLSTENLPDDAVYENVQENQRFAAGGSAIEASQRTALATRPIHATNPSAGATKPSAHAPKPSARSTKPPVLKKPSPLDLQSGDGAQAVLPSSPAQSSAPGTMEYDNAAFSDDVEGFLPGKSVPIPAEVTYDDINLDDIQVHPNTYDRLNLP